MTAKGQDPVTAIVQDGFGPPDVLRLSDTGLPEAGPDDALVRVHAAALNPATGTSCGGTRWSRG